MPRFHFLLITFFVFTPTSFAAQAKVAEVAWVEFIENQHRLFVARYDGELWSEPLVVHDSENTLTSPAMSTNHQGDKLLVWTERRKGKAVLNFKTKTVDQESWGEAQLLSDYGLENLATSIVVDQTNRTWVFWASDGSDLSDIVEIHSNAGSSWTEPRRIHPNNEVPDIHPVAKLNTAGEIVISWARYSFEQQDYITESHLMAVAEAGGDLNNHKEQSALVDLVKLKDIPLPVFLPENAISHIHFPTNKMLQSEPIIPSVSPTTALGENALHN